MSAADEALLAQANERLRQERETFDQQKLQDQRAFRAQNAMAWVVIITLPSILAIALFIILLHRSFDPTIVKLASGALLVDGLGAAISIYKSNLGRAPKHGLSPVTAQPRLPSSPRSQANRAPDPKVASEIPHTSEAGG